jgi:Protein of unknown function (DUF1566)
LILWSSQSIDGVDAMLFNLEKKMNIKHFLFGLLLSLCLPVSAQSQARFTYSADGSEVTDSLFRLTWRRCVEGMVWSGTSCTGTPGSFNHNQAFAHAQSQSGWRLPNVKELASVVDETRQIPAIDPVAFPGTPAESHWSSTPQAGFPGLAWFVSFYDGFVSDYLGALNRNALGRNVVRVRLVRSNP